MTLRVLRYLGFVRQNCAVMVENFVAFYSLPTANDNANKLYFAPEYRTTVACTPRVIVVGFFNNPRETKLAPVH